MHNRDMRRDGCIFITSHTITNRQKHAHTCHRPTHRTQAHTHTDTHNDNHSCPLCSPQRCIKNFQKSHLKFQNGQCSEKKYLISPLKIIIPSLTKPIPGKFVDITVHVPYSIDYHKYFGFDLISPEEEKNCQSLRLAQYLIFCKLCSAVGLWVVVVRGG